MTAKTSVSCHCGGLGCLAWGLAHGSCSINISCMYERTSLCFPQALVICRCLGIRDLDGSLLECSLHPISLCLHTPGVGEAHPLLRQR